MTSPAATFEELIAAAVRAAALSEVRRASETFLACHDAFMIKQERATAYAMKDAADALRALLAAPDAEAVCPACDGLGHVAGAAGTPDPCICGGTGRAPAPPEAVVRTPRATADAVVAEHEEETKP